jgi:hypothetical protein
MDFALPPGVDILEIFRVRPDSYKPGDAAELEDMLLRVAPEREKRHAALTDASQYERQLVSTVPELEGLAAQAKLKLQQLLIPRLDEIVATTSACDVQGLAAQLRPVQDEHSLIQEAISLLLHRRIPAARLRRFEAALDMRKIEELEASLLANLAQARIIEKLTAAGVFQNENRVALIDESVERLRAIAKEAARQVGLAEDELREERKRQASIEQQRQASGQITRAEVFSAIPVYDGHAA